jgi:hypothetical protein
MTAKEVFENDEKDLKKLTEALFVGIDFGSEDDENV